MKAEIFEYSGWVNQTDAGTLKDKYNQILRSAGFLILGYIEYNFSPMGFTALWLLGESHFAIHTFPEESKTFINLASCSKEYYNEFLSHESRETK